MNEGILDRALESEEVVFYKPSLMLRVKCSLIDASVIMILLFVAAWINAVLDIKSDLVRAIIMLSILLYEPIFVAFGNTIGQKYMGLRVVKASVYKETEGKVSINIFNSLIRYIFKITLGWISLLLIHSDSYGQAIHDKFGNSIMMNV